MRVFQNIEWENLNNQGLNITDYFMNFHFKK